jgi:hypothetical protein
MEKLLFRSDVSSHLAHVLATNLATVIERQVKDAIAKTFIPVYSQQASTMHQELIRELRGEIHGVKSELTAWQNEAFRNHDVRLTSDFDFFSTVIKRLWRLLFVSSSIPSRHCLIKSSS